MAKTLVYQLYPLSWRGGLKEMGQHLSRIAALGVDYIWLSPIYTSPREDGGYDVANYKAVDYRFKRSKGYGFHQFIEQAHKLGLGVLMDLPINHTSTRHRWFDTHPEYYCWSKNDRSGWRNLFNGGSAWQYLESDKRHYLHLFHPSQADLNWFPRDHINQALVWEFRDIVSHWLKRGVDGFRLDFPQGINKDFAKETLEIKDLLSGIKSIEVINAIFKENEDIFLIMECFDPTFGKIVQEYTDHTQIDFVMNVMLKDQIAAGDAKFLGLIDQHTRNPHFMLELESHDSPRFPSRGDITPEGMIWSMFNSDAEGICLYQGQELGLNNPTKEQLPDARLLELDAQTAMRYIKGESLDVLRPLSRANARVHLPMKEYAKQEQNPSSYLNLTKDWIHRWRDKSPSRTKTVQPPSSYESGEAI